MLPDPSCRPPVAQKPRHAASNRGSRARLLAAIVTVDCAPTRFTPRRIVSPIGLTVLAQPTDSSIAFRQNCERAQASRRRVRPPGNPNVSGPLASIGPESGLLSPAVPRPHRNADTLCGHSGANAGWNLASSIDSRVSSARLCTHLLAVAEAFARECIAGTGPGGSGATGLEWTLSSPPPFCQLGALPRIEQGTSAGFTHIEIGSASRPSRAHAGQVPPDARHPKRW